MNLSTMHALYVEELRDLYSAAHQVMRALPKLAQSASDSRLRIAFTDQIHQAQVHIDRLDKIFARLGVGPKGSACLGIEGLIAECKYLVGDDAQPLVLDMALIAAFQRAGHYLIASLGSALTLARRLRHNMAAALLQEMLEVSIDADQRLTDLAEAFGEAEVAEVSGLRGLGDLVHAPQQRN